MLWNSVKFWVVKMQKKIYTTTQPGNFQGQGSQQTLPFTANSMAVALSFTSGTAVFSQRWKNAEVNQLTGERNHEISNKERFLSL